MKVSLSQIHRAFSEQIMSVPSNKFSENIDNSSTDKFYPPISVSDWLIFCWGNLILHQKKK